MDGFGESFLAAVLGFAIGRGLYEFIVRAIRKGCVKGAPDQDEGDRGEDNGKSFQ